MIHAASHFYHEKRVAWVYISMRACHAVPIVMGLRLAALWVAGAPLLTNRFKRAQVFRGPPAKQPDRAVKRDGALSEQDYSSHL